MFSNILENRLKNESNNRKLNSTLRGSTFTTVSHNDFNNNFLIAYSCTAGEKFLPDPGPCSEGPHFSHDPFSSGPLRRTPPHDLHWHKLLLFKCFFISCCNCFLFRRGKWGIGGRNRDSTPMRWGLWFCPIVCGACCCFIKEIETWDWSPQPGVEKFARNAAATKFLARNSRKHFIVLFFFPKTVVLSYFI